MDLYINIKLKDFETMEVLNLNVVIENVIPELYYIQELGNLLL